MNRQQMRVRVLVRRVITVHLAAPLLLRLCVAIQADIVPQAAEGPYLCRRDITQ